MRKRSEVFAMAFNAPVKRTTKSSPLRGSDKVAALLLAMGRELSGGVLKEFDPEEIKVVTRAAAELKPISTPELESIIEEFAQHFSTGPNIFGTVGELEKLLNGVLPPEQITDIISEVLGNKTKSVWERISLVSESLLANYLLKEHPQTAALVLSKVKPACAARVMSQLPSEIRHDLMRRMLSLKPVVEEAMTHHREDDARRLHDQLRAQSRLRYLPAHGRHHQQDGTYAIWRNRCRASSSRGRNRRKSSRECCSPSTTSSISRPRRACSSSTRSRPIAS